MCGSKKHETCVRKGHYKKCESPDCDETVQRGGLCPSCERLAKEKINKERKQKEADAAEKKKAEEDSWYKDSGKSRKPRKK